MQIELLKKVSGLLPTFHCSNDTMDTYFQNKALSDGDAVTYCFLEDDLQTIIALSSLSCNGIIIKSGELLHSYPAIEIKMFAVNDCYKHKDCPLYQDSPGLHWSDYCFDKTISIIYSITDKYCGADRVFLYSVPQAVNFYVRQHMEKFTDLMHGDDRMFLEDCTPMYMHL